MCVGYMYTYVTIWHVDISFKCGALLFHVAREGYVIMGGFSFVYHIVQ